jgi:3-isopropylmalate/(R)-2-methylmalate dehydratase small subunit
MEDLDKDFIKKVKKGDIIVAGKNFGCGSSREHAPVAIKAAGISCVIAESFARIFFRNAINIGLPIVESKGASGSINGGDVIEVDLTEGKVKNTTSGREYVFRAFPEFLHKIIESGGLVDYVKRGMKERVGLLGGEFSLDSAPGVGTQISIRVPVEPGAVRPEGDGGGPFVRCFRREKRGRLSVIFRIGPA